MAAAGSPRRKGDFTLRFWGVRGSLPSPGAATSRTGGNTPCLEVRAGDRVIVLDLGSGARPLGDALRSERAAAPLDATVFLTHYHWDHIQGLPFFGPGFVPRNRLTIYGPKREGKDVKQLLGAQMAEPYFPVPLSALRANVAFRTVRSGSRVKLGDTVVRARATHHPGGVLAYRVERAGRSLVYATDHEHGTRTDRALVDFARGADVLVMDAMYTPEEYVGGSGLPRIGWGHSTWRDAAAIAKHAGVGTLALFHHEPDRTDDAIAGLVRAARRAFGGRTIAARELETIAIG